MMNKINDGNNIRDGKKKLRFFIPMYSYCLWSGRVLFETSLGLVVNTHCDFMTTAIKQCANKEKLKPIS
jgi:hypothetical protein